MPELHAKILGVGSALPPRVVTNEELAKDLGVTGPWIRVRTGVEKRHYADQGVYTSDLAAQASRNALHDAKLMPEDLDLIIFATLSPDYTTPGTGGTLQAKLGIAEKHIPCIDIRQQCSGFIYGLEIAKMFIETEKYQRILLVGAELHSSALDFSDRGKDITIIFGDGAGAVVIGAVESEDPKTGIFFTETHADGRCTKDLYQIVGDTSRWPVLTYNPKNHEENIKMFPQMDGKVVTVTAVNTLAGFIPEILEKNDMTIDDIQWILPHQANIHINNFLALKMGLAKSNKFLNNIDHVGNTTAGSIPILLDEYVKNKTIKRGDVLACVAFGAGFTWGGALIQY